MTRFSLLSVGVALFSLLATSSCAIAADDVPVLPDGFEKQCAVSRGPTGSGYYTAKNVPTEWDEASGKNIIWKSKVPLAGFCAPVVWNDKIFMSGATLEKREIYCFNAKDGSLAWTGTYKSDPKASKEYKVYESLDAFMHACPTAATDGKRVYAIFANGELVAFDMDGKFLWSKLIGDTSSNQYGFSNSLLIYRDSVIVQFEGDSSSLVRVKADGTEVYRKTRDESGWSSPILIKVGDKYQVVCAGKPNIAGYDPETGGNLWKFDGLSGDMAPSPVCGGGIVSINMDKCGILGVNPADKSKKAWTIEELKEGSFSDSVSMTCNNTHLYQFNKSSLACIDLKKGSVVYEKEMDDSASYASPIVIGDNIYLFCGDKAIIGSIKPEFTAIGKGKLKEISDVNVAVVDGRMYIRTEKSLYAIGSK